MADFVVRSFNGKRHHSIECYPSKPGGGREEYRGPELERIPISDDAVSLGLERLIELYQIGPDALRNLRVSVLEPTATLDGLSAVPSTPSDPLGLGIVEERDPVTGERVITNRPAVEALKNAQRGRKPTEAMG